MATIDLTHKAKALLYVDKGKSTNGLDIVYYVSFADIPLTLDTSYTLLLDEGLATEITYTVGAGLTIIPETKSIVWDLDTAALTVKQYEGYLVSESNIEGIYLEIAITLIVK